MPNHMYPIHIILSHNGDSYHLLSWLHSGETAISSSLAMACFSNIVESRITQIAIKLIVAVARAGGSPGSAECAILEPVMADIMRF